MPPLINSQGTHGLWRPDAYEFARAAHDGPSKRQYSTLRVDQQKQVDEKVLKETEDRLVLAGDLRAAGLVNILDHIGVTESKYDQQSDVGDAEQSMGIEVDHDEDRTVFNQVSIPVPCTIFPFRLGARQLAASRYGGEGLDMSNISLAARKVAEKVEEVSFLGNASLNINGVPIYGVTTQPNVNTVSGSSWGTATNIYTNVTSGIAALEADGYPGPYNLYVAKTQYGEMRQLTGDNRLRTAMDEVMGLSQINAVRAADRMADGTAALIQMTDDVIDISIGKEVDWVEWTGTNPFVSRFCVWGIMVVRVKSTYSGKSGVAYITGI